jgi:osmotically-inducible protein OsmY
MKRWCFDPSGLLLTGILGLCLAGCNDAGKHAGSTGTRPPVAGGSTAGQASGTPADRDNTAVNVRDRSDGAKTPINQNENKADVNTTAEIRKRIVDTKLSVNAQNVKVITQDGRVTLRGPVKSAAEKRQIEDIAVAVAGAGKVDNLLEVESNP